LRRAVRPAIAPVELGNQHQPAMIRCVDVAHEGADLGGKLVDGTHDRLLFMRTVYAAAAVDAFQK
jgi:hypothetical protein